MMSGVGRGVAVKIKGSRGKYGGLLWGERLMLGGTATRWGRASGGFQGGGHPETGRK